jgi:hypothetical protein
MEVHRYVPAEDDLFAAALDRYVTQARQHIETDEKLTGGPQREPVAFPLDMEPYRGLHPEACGTAE